MRATGWRKRFSDELTELIKSVVIRLLVLGGLLPAPTHRDDVLTTRGHTAQEQAERGPC
jgi:hypothetical protein